jgi:transposase
MLVLKACWRSSKEVPMGIIGGLDVHRSQITYDWIDSASGQRQRGRLAPATREHLRMWLGQFAGQQAAFAVEGCTGWRYVVEELGRAGIAAHLAEPADTSAARGPKRRAKTDQLDARHLRELLAAGRLPESWIPPTHVLEVRTLVRCYKALTDEHTAWLQRIHATLFHHGVPAERNLLAPDRRARLQRGTGLSPAARQLITVALGTLDHLDAELDRLRAELVSVAHRQPGCQALDALYGIGPVTAVAIWAELGDVGRFTSSRHAVRHTGLDVTVYSSDGKRTPGHLSPPRPAGAALGAVRGGQVRRSALFPRPRLLPPGQATAGRQPGCLERGPQAGAPLLPHPWRARRPRLRAAVGGLHRWAGGLTRWGPCARCPPR